MSLVLINPYVFGAGTPPPPPVVGDGVFVRPVSGAEGFFLNSVDYDTGDLENVDDWTGLDPAFANSITCANTTPDGGYLAVARSGANCEVRLLKRNGNAFDQVQNLTIPGARNANDIAWDRTGTYMAITFDGNSSSPYLLIYKRTSDTLTQVGSYAGLNNFAAGCGFSPTSNHLVIVRRTQSVNIAVCDWFKYEGDTFTRLTGIGNPDVNPASQGGAGRFGVSWHPSGDYVAIGYQSDSLVYKRNGDTLSRITPFNVSPGYTRYVAYSPDGNYLAVCCNLAANAVYIYKITGETYTRLTADIPNINNVPFDLAWSDNSEYLLIGVSSSTPAHKLWKRTGDTFVDTPLPTLPGGNSGTYTGMCFVPNPIVSE